ncbi:hypothetical protein OIDMADRAFT_21920 [Oidiodendron maius Zn]|uniref:Uncharacterized protein n=1 Tax=Oidiodendron maius (strain Zn) TaxID=913774 RepID=A0A0C3HFK9_OIDMZ|nr:hypothetical protein OIDMADRAFT_21920 [Oidiodendron maius Zn]
MEFLTGSGVVEELWNVEATIHFTDPDNFRHDIRAFLKDALHRDSLCDHSILVTGFPAESIVANDDDDDEEGPLIPRHTKVLYLKSLSLLIITMASSSHEIASRQFLLLLDRKLTAMNCEEEIIATGAALREMENVKKSPDESWGPISKENITLAVEAGVSESSRTLAIDAKIWLEHLECHVTQVVTIKISRTRPEVQFTLWVKAPQERDTRADHPERSYKAQEVSVVLEEERPAAEGSLTISFEKLFDRRPRPGTAERDIVLSARELGGIARIVWVKMKFIQLE